MSDPARYLELLTIARRIAEVHRDPEAAAIKPMGLLSWRRSRPPRA